MRWNTLLSLALFAPANAMLRFSCSQLVIERTDPLGAPGMNPSQHVHQVVGGNAFNVTMDTSNDISKMATCTTCTFSEDFSNYWTANLWYQHRNGSFKRVPQMAGQFLDGANGGTTVYYIQPYDGRTKVTAFTPGFRMLVGDAGARADTNSVEQRQSSYRCFEANFGGEAGAPGTGTDTRDLPDRPCPGGIRSNIFFPTCWDGKTLDSPDHKSHVAFPTSGSFETNGPCPATHPVKIPQVFYEVNWDTREFNGADMWPDASDERTQPFVLSMGDGTGYGQHADYVFGWKGDALQRAMDANCNVACPTLQSQSVQEANKCTIEKHQNEEIEGWLDALPGNREITYKKKRRV